MAAESHPANHRGAITLIALVVIVTAGTLVVTTRHSRTPTPKTISRPIPTSKVPLELRHVSPAQSSIGVAPDSPITFRFSAPIAPSSPMPTIRPATTGRWSRPSATEVRFTPTQRILPLTRVTVTVAKGSGGPRSTTGEVLTTAVTLSYTTAPASTLRLQQLLAELDYLPVRFVPSGTAVGTIQVASTADSATVGLDTEPTTPSAISLAPRAGTLPWRFASIPRQLASTFTPGLWGSATLGAVIAFQAEHHLGLDGSPGPTFWTALLRSVAQRQVTSRPYDYLLVSETEPQSLYVWQEGKIVLQTPVNTGVSSAPTPQGTWPVYLRYSSTTMSGVNPDGSHYSDPGVPWVSYFNGSDAVHGFPRPGYGYPQSVGCVEVPIPSAAAIYPLDPYGTLVTVTTGNLASEFDVASPRFISPPPTPTVVTTTTVPPTTTSVPKRAVTPTTRPRTTTTTTATTT
ncbi:MAG TPA: L,D-transpeptidase family protein, partial [Acidimicrobiales bacterium]|nr:L,D-transpeptidase family protein [Acidimicrobiales bacterium]